MSKIEWTDATWNPIVGCSILSPGCTNCYAMKMAARIEAMNRGIDDNGYAVRPAPGTGVHHYDGLTKRVNGNTIWTGKLALAPDRILREPMRRRRPTMYFVNSMGDLFHEDTPTEWIDRVFAVMALSPQHTFQVLTKRSSLMRSYFRIDHDHDYQCRVDSQIWSLLGTPEGTKIVHDGKWWARWPLPNVWLGVSTERQKEADERVPDLVATPAAKRFVSAEPLLGPIDFRRWTIVGPEGGHEYAYSRSQLIDWIIVGGESGHGARPMERAWADSIVQQCKAGGVAAFVKQLGAAFSDARNGIAGAALKVSRDAGGVSQRLRHRKGADMAEWPLSLKVREMPA